MTDTTLKLIEAFNRHNSLYNALLGNLKTLTTAHTEEVTITLDAGKVRALSYYHPDNVAALGGILMERITD